MSGPDHRAERLLERMGRLEVVELPDDERAGQVARMTRVVEASLGRARAQRTRNRRAWLGVAALAAAGVALLIFWRGLDGISRGLDAVNGVKRVSVITASGPVQVLSLAGKQSELGGPGATLEADSELRTAPAASAEVELASGARVALQASTRLRLPSDARDTLAERLELGGGNISLRVPKLSAGRSLAVATPDSIVTVRGTRFSVAVVASAGALVTRVAVEQGRVEVQSSGRTAWLGPGETWSSEIVPAKGAAPDASAAAAASELERIRATPPLEISAPNRAKAVAAPPVDQSSLAEENELFGQALRKAHGGDKEGAIADLDRFQLDHPRSPLTQAVRAERFRVLLEAGQKERAAREARRYLSDYPNGFARDDAKRTALYGVDGTP
jgi:ferric-dicitrate binding protein FerR (iron transport regulator)